MQKLCDQTNFELKKKLYFGINHQKVLGHDKFSLVAMKTERLSENLGLFGHKAFAFATTDFCLQINTNVSEILHAIDVGSFPRRGIISSKRNRNITLALANY